MASPQVRRINNMLRRYDSPYAGRGKVFVNKGRKYGVDPALLVAIAGKETSFGKAGRGPAVNNPYGLGPGMTFGSLQHSTDYLARLLKKDYIGQGLGTIGAISGKYAPVGASNDPNNLNSSWTSGVSQFYKEAGGSGQLLMKGGATATPASKRGRSGPQKGTPSTGGTKAITDEPFVLMAREQARTDFLGSMIEASQRRSRQELGTTAPVMSSLSVLKEAEQRKPITLVPAMPGGKGKPSKGSQQANKNSPKFIDGTGPIKNYTAGGGPDAHGSRPLGNWQSDHAWDLMAPAGTPVYATVDGIIDPNSGFGFTTNGSTVWGRKLTLRGGGNAFFYTHLGKYAKGVKPGRRVKKGQLLGWLGKPPGFAPHLHIGLLHGDLSDYMGGT